MRLLSTPQAGRPRLADQRRKGLRFWHRDEDRESGLGSRTWILPVAIVLAFAALVSAQQTAGSDVWWHLRLGQQVAESGELGGGDTFSHTFAGQPQRNTEWLGDLLLYGGYKAAGFDGLYALMVAAVGATAVLLLLAMFWSRRTRDPLVWACAAALAVVLTLLALRWRLGLPRPFLFTFAFMGGFLALLNHHQRTRNPKSLYWLLPLQLLWANMSGAAFFGLILYGAHVIGPVLRRERAPRLIGLGLALALLVAANPDGFDTYRNLWLSQTADGQWLLMIAEFTPLTAVLGAGIERLAPFLLLAALAFGAIFGLGGWREPERLLPLLLFSYLAYSHNRAVGFCAIVAAEPAFRLLERLLSSLAARGKNARLAMALLTLAVIGGSAWWVVESTGPAFGKTRPAIQREHVDGAIAFLSRAGITGNMINDYDIGAYLIWHAPERRVFIDGRAGVLYPASFLAEYEELLKEPAAWDLGVERWGLTHAVFRYDARELQKPDTQFSFPKHLDANPKWAPVFWDDRSVVYVRRDTVDSAFLNQYEYRLVKPMLTHYEVIAAQGRHPDTRGRLYQAIEREIAINPANQEPRMAKITLLLQDPTPAAKEQVFAELLHCLGVRPDFAVEHALMASFLAEQGQLDEARAQVEQALRLNPENAEAVALKRRLQ